MKTAAEKPLLFTQTTRTIVQMVMNVQVALGTEQAVTVGTLVTRDV